MSTNELCFMTARELAQKIRQRELSAVEVMEAHLRQIDEGVELAVRVTPKAGRNVVAGVHLDAAGASWLVVKVSDAAEAGRANDAAIRLLARRCGVAPSAVRLVSGAASRWKRLIVTGDPVQLARSVAAAAQEPAA